MNFNVYVQLVLFFEQRTNDVIVVVKTVLNMDLLF